MATSASSPTLLGNDEYHTLRHAEVRDTAAFLRTLSPEQWNTPSLCTDWRVKDVIGHMVSGAENGLGKFLPLVLKNRFSIDKAAYGIAVKTADSRSTAQLVDDWERYETGPVSGIAKTIKPRELLVDHIVHSSDVMRPLGVPRTVPADRLRAALDVAPTIRGPVGSAKRAQGLRLAATDLDWAWGTGPEVRGTGEALLVALTGRPAALADLSGDGVSMLTGRCRG